MPGMRLNLPVDPAGFCADFFSFCVQPAGFGQHLTNLSADLGEQIGFSCTRLAKAHPSPLIIDLFQALSRISDAR